MKGYVQVYTGDGKGKTTAALGLALRAAGAGLRVLIIQFVKGREYSEHKALRRLDDLITIRKCGRRCFVHGKPAPADLKAARRGLREAGKAVASGDYDVVILDEAIIAAHLKLIPAPELTRLAKEKPPDVELVFTGRNATPELIKAADLVTDMREISHYYRKGVPARRGIEK